MALNALTPNTSPAVLQNKQRLGIIGNAPALTAAIERAIKVAPIDLSVLIMGESGSGKEFFPKIIHQNSARKHAKYIAVNCGAIPEGTIDSELFGHEKGAFTGAIASRKGYFEEADGGTIFLDEVGELPLTTQARLLRVLESGEFMKVGSSVVQKTNIRIVAATNVDMQKAVASGRFREDLYYRLSTIAIHVPPLRDRGSDIALLARKFAADFAERYRTAGIQFDPRATEYLQHYNWPGNVRQLKNIIEQISLFEAGNTIDADTIAQYLPEMTTTFAPALSTDRAKSYEREREVLFNLIFRLQNEIDDLRHKIEHPEGHAAGDAKLEHLTPEMPAQVHSLVKVSTAAVHPHDTGHNDITDVEAHEDIESDNSDMSLDATRRSAIIDSLRRNNGRRKAAAAELNISERTLYRKIKEYGLE